MFHKALALKPNSDIIYQALASLYFYKLDNQQEKARECALKALEINDQNYSARMIAIFTDKKYEERLDLLENLRDKRPELSCKIFHLMGLVLY